MNRLGIDLGGTKIEGIVLDEENNVLRRKRIPTPSHNYQQILNSIADLINQIKISECTIGICTPGAISKKTGLVKNSNTQCLIGKPLKEDLLGREVVIQNDANCFAMAEATLGNAKDYRVVFGVIMGTGVGGGIVIDRQVQQGRSNIAGEWGHHTICKDGPECYCGKRGCVETYISGPALEKRWKDMTGEQSSLKEIVKMSSSKVGNRWKREFLENFGISLANVIDILDPDVIVLGGGVSNISFLYEEGREYVYRYVFSDIVDTPILQNKLGDSAGVFGAKKIKKSK